MVLSKKLIYDKCEFEVANCTFDKESQAYDACTFTINKKHVIYRKSKITPTKTGQFVTLWNRDENGVTQPYNATVLSDLVVIDTPVAHRLGQFVFPKSVLIEQGILSSKTRSGKRGFRVYPPWDTTTSKQAQKTQRWQLDYFLVYSNEKPIEISRAKSLYLQQ